MTQTPPLDVHVLQCTVASLVRRYDGMFSPETIERYVHESYAALARTAKVRNFLAVLTEHFANDRLRALAQAQGQIAKPVPQVLFVCAPNIGRSQIAAALLAHRAGGAVEARSAGSAPGTEVHPVVVKVLHEHAVELVSSYPKPLTDDVVRAADIVVAIGRDNACPIYPEKRYLDWPIERPAEETPEQIRALVDELDAHVRDLWAEIQSLLPDPSHAAERHVGPQADRLSPAPG